MSNKCDVHRHLGGSIGPSTIWAIIRRQNLYQHSSSLRDVIFRTTFLNDNNYEFMNFLQKFDILDKLHWDAWAIEIAIEQVCHDLMLEGIKYTEISLSLNKFIKDTNLDITDIIIFISELFTKYSNRYHTNVKLLLSLRYDSDRNKQIIFSDIIDNDMLAAKFIGIDLVGDEKLFDTEFYRPIMKKWNDAHKQTRAHVGELPGTTQNVYSAITELNVTRIAHGIQADARTLRIAKDRGIYFDLALHSNIYTGACSDITGHAVRRMLDVGNIVTLNTDDPVQFSCTIDDEYRLLSRSKLATDAEVLAIQQNAEKLITN